MWQSVTRFPCPSSTLALLRSPSAADRRRRTTRLAPLTAPAAPPDETCGVVQWPGTPTSLFNCSNLSALVSELNGVSDDPQFVGSWSNTTTGGGFVSPGDSGQSCYSFNPTGSIATWVGGVNGDGQVVGSFMDSNQQVHGFIYNYGNGINPPAPQQFEYPGATTTSLYGIDNNGLMLGYADLASGGGTYFLLDENNGTATPVGDPNYTLNGLNDTSYIAGFTGDNYGEGCADGLLLELALVP